MPSTTDEISELFRELNTIRQRVAELSIQEDSLIERIEHLSQRENKQRPFKTGDRVLITNEIKLKRNTTVTRKDRAGTITKVTPKRIYILTDNGKKTWRAHKNVTHES